MPWDSGVWDDGAWDSDAGHLRRYFQQKPQPKHHRMKRQDYYPSRFANQIPWLENYATKLPTHGPTTGVDPAVVTASVADAKWLRYVLSAWLSTVRAFSLSTTEAVDQALTGELLPDPEEAITMPAFTAPTPPAGVTPRPPGALTRIFELIAQIKASNGFNDTIGTDLQIVGAEDTSEHTAPRLRVEVTQGEGSQSATLKFTKFGHMGVYIESRRGTGAWEFLAIDTESPYVDDRPLLVAGQPEVREYRVRFWDKGTPNGDWTDVAKVTLAP